MRQSPYRTMSRQTLLQELQAVEHYDLTVVGGGATGLGVALHAALRGHREALLEGHDFASGTSSRSTKLLHGGVRYLAQGNMGLVREALRERSVVMAMAPHLAQPLAFVMPSYNAWSTPLYALGLKLYDVLAGTAGLGPTRWLNRHATLAALPGLRAAGLRNGVQYWDGQFEDARLALALAQTAARAGALLLNHTRVTAVTPPDAQGLHTVHACDAISGRTLALRSRAVVNATGVWVDQLRTQSAPDAQRLVSPSQGVHVVVDQRFMPTRQALLVPRTRDGRVLFAVPWLGALVLGTTDTPRTDLPQDPEPFAHEVDFILQEAAQVLQQPITRQDVKSVWVGLRPLVAQQAGQETKALSREHTLVREANGMISITGGKWTTFRVMAEDTLAACVAAGALPARAAPQSLRAPLVGALPGAAAVSLAQPPGPHLYGTAQADVARLAGADQPLGMGLTEAMVRFAAREEWAITVEDVLARRWRALFLDAREARRMAAAVARILQAETGHDPQCAAFEALCERYTLA